MSSIKNNVADILWRSPGGQAEVLSLHLSQKISEIPRVVVEIKTQNPAWAASTFLNQEAHVDIMSSTNLAVPRAIKGIVTRFRQSRTGHGNLPSATSLIFYYEVEIKPKFFRLTKRKNSRVFRENSVQDITQIILDEHGVDMQWLASGPFKPRDQCVQYQETDYQFISRLLEEEGICFCFDYPLKKVIFCNESQQHQPLEPSPNIQYSEEQSAYFPFGANERVFDLSYEESLTTGKMARDHHNYDDYMIQYAVEHSSRIPQFQDLEDYTHTIDALDLSVTTQQALVDCQRAASENKTLQGFSFCRHLQVGYVMDLSQHFRAELNKKWLITSLEMVCEQGKVRSAFSAKPADKPFRPERKTPWPKVQGIQTAVVTGPEGSEIYLDNLNRCKIMYFWDRNSEPNDSSSMWVRVSQGYAGRDFGIQWIPQVGHEVLVDFVQGNPDLPVVVGRVYNGLNTPPLGPGQKWQNIIKTIRDNHILFDDVQGGERIEIRAQKDMHTHVLNNDSNLIGNNKSIQVGHDHTELIGNDMSLTVANNCTDTIGVNRTLMVGSNSSRTIGGSEVESIGQDVIVTIGNDSSLTVVGNHSEAIGKHKLALIEGDHIEEVEGRYGLTVDKNITIESKKSMTIKAKDQITLECGNAKIILKKNGNISIQGSQIEVKGSGAVTIKGSKVAVN
ncbi:MAG: type VI secretion system tip protein VgrG [Acidobacteria bacterium]|nr:type VI secretion system tip protein VgrG [Acidobacteriota bacterium]